MNESRFSLRLSDLLNLAFVAFCVAMGSAMAYGFWQWVLTPAVPFCR